MATNTQFSIAVHLLAGLASSSRPEVTSADLAASVNTSASFVRRTLARLSHAGLIETTTGKGGACRLGKCPEQISLLDVYRAVEAPPAFAIHQYPEHKPCPVSCGIKPCLEQVLQQTQGAVEAVLERKTLADVLCDLNGV